MLNKKPILFISLFLIIHMFLSSCFSMASFVPMSDLPMSASSIDFEKQAKLYYQSRPTELITDETKNEYYFESFANITEEKFFPAIRLTLRKFNYRIEHSSLENKCVIGKRGFGLNELSSTTAVYYKKDSLALKVYILTKIKQDTHGGFRENRAMDIGKQLVREMFKP